VIGAFHALGSSFAPGHLIQDGNNESSHYVTGYIEPFFSDFLTGTYIIYQEGRTVKHPSRFLTFFLGSTPLRSFMTFASDLHPVLQFLRLSCALSRQFNLVVAKVHLRTERPWGRDMYASLMLIAGESATPPLGRMALLQYGPGRLAVASPTPGWARSRSTHRSRAAFVHPVLLCLFMNSSKRILSRLSSPRDLPADSKRARIISTISGHVGLGLHTLARCFLRQPAQELPNRFRQAHPLPPGSLRRSAQTRVRASTLILPQKLPSKSAPGPGAAFS
jgi:hypothetical protein